MQRFLSARIVSGRESLRFQRCFSQVAQQKEASLHDNGVHLPKLPPFDYSPPPYTGPSVLPPLLTENPTNYSKLNIGFLQKPHFLQLPCKMPREIILVLGLEPEGLLPSMELCGELTTVTRVTIVIPSHLFPLVPDYLLQNPRVLIAPIPSQDPPHDQRNQIRIELERILSRRIRFSGRPVCAIIDVKMGWTAEIFHNVKVPTIAFFNSRACWPATELASWGAHPLNLNPVEVPFINREPEEIRVAYKQRPYGPPGGHGALPENHGAGHPGPGPVHGVGHPGLDPVWVELLEGSIAVMINIYEDLEPQFIDYIANQLGKPVWAVGPLGGVVQHGFPARARATLDAFKTSILEKVD